MSSLTIEEFASTDVPFDLLLLADPSEEKVRAYLPASRSFVARSDGIDVGVCTVQARGVRRYELMNIAVRPDHQRRGIGSTLLRHVIDLLRRAGVDALEVGTGSFGYQLAFYQKHGFRVTGIDRDFFVEQYDEPIFEDGIQLKDMLRLTLKFKDGAASIR